MELKEDIAILAEEFKANQKVFIAVGDEVRQHILLEMLKHGNVNGMRVNDIAATTNLSRPAVSHLVNVWLTFFQKDTKICVNICSSSTPQKKSPVNNAFAVFLL